MIKRTTADGRVAMSAATDFDGSLGDPAAALATLAEAGFTHLHWCHQWNTDHLYSDREISYIAGLLKANNLTLLDIHGSDGGASGSISCWYAWMGPEEVYRKNGVELVLNRMRMMAMLRAEGSLMMHLPLIHDGESEAQRKEYWRQIDVLRRSLDELMPFSLELGIPIALENLPGDTGEILERLFAEYPADCLGLCYDSGHGNMCFEGYPAHGLDLLERNVDRLLALHLHDNDGIGDLHQPPFYGTVDWQRLIPMIERSKSYNAPLSFEMGHSRVSKDAFPGAADWAKDAYARCCSCLELV